MLLNNMKKQKMKIERINIKNDIIYDMIRYYIKRHDTMLG